MTNVDMDHIILNCRRNRADWLIAEYSSDDYRFSRIYYRGFNDDIGCRGGGVKWNIPLTK